MPAVPDFTDVRMPNLYIMAQRYTTVTVTPAKNKYALREKFKVTLTASADIGGGIGKLSLPIDGSATGSCERYSK